jgi:hypothetical protein
VSAPTDPRILRRGRAIEADALALWIRAEHRLSGRAHLARWHLAGDLNGSGNRKTAICGEVIRNKDRLLVLRTWVPEGIVCSDCAARAAGDGPFVYRIGGGVR